MNTTEFKAKIRRLTNTSVLDYPDADLVSDLNGELSYIRISILRDRGVLEFDDTNYTNLPIGTFPIASNGVCKIVDDGDGNSIDTIHKVAFLVGDEYIDVARMTLGEGSQDILTRNQSVDRPTHYYEVGNSIVFPGVTGGTAKVWFDREIDFLVAGDTTKVPGIPSAYHNLAAFRTAYNYAIEKQLPNENSILRRIQMEEDKLEQFEANRRVDEPVRFEPVMIRGL